MLKQMRVLSGLTLVFAIISCNSSLYVRDGVTDGDTFYLAPQAFDSADAALQSWVSYSLIRSTCQLAMGGENPARVSTYDCELQARQHLIDAWQQKREHPNAYLDTLQSVGEAGFLEEYVAHYLGRASWKVPPEVDVAAFEEWRCARLRWHKPETRLIGSWGYRRGLEQ